MQAKKITCKLNAKRKGGKCKIRLYVKMTLRSRRWRRGGDGRGRGDSTSGSSNKNIHVWTRAETTM